MELVKPLVHQTLGRVYDNRDKKFIHCSDLTQPDFCAREHYIYNKFNYNRNTQFIPTATLLTWQYGRYIENEFRNTWLRARVIGDWMCSKCDNLSTCTTFSLLENSVMCQCKTRSNYYYVEPVFKVEHLNILGSPDCFIYFNGYGIVPVELKTIDKDAFLYLGECSKEHVLRSQLYLKLIHEATLCDSSLRGKIHTDFMQVVYFSKSFGLKDDNVKKYNPEDRAFSPIKEFTVYRDDTKVEHLWQKLQQYEKCSTLQTPPERICDTIKCARAKKCNVRELCFTQM